MKKRATFVFLTYGRNKMFEDVLLDFFENKIIPGEKKEWEWETYIIDNHSKVPVRPQILEKYKANYVYLQDNYGATTGFNTGFRLARGDIIFKLDNDIFMPPGFLTTAYKILTVERNPKKGEKQIMCVGWVVEKNLSVTRQKIKPETIKGISVKKAQSLIPFGNQAFSRSVLEDIGYWDERFFAFYCGGDSNMGIRILQKYDQYYIGRGKHVGKPKDQREQKRKAGKINAKTADHASKLIGKVGPFYSPWKEDKPILLNGFKWHNENRGIWRGE